MIDVVRIVFKLKPQEAKSPILLVDFIPLHKQFQLQGEELKSIQGSFQVQFSDNPKMTHSIFCDDQKFIDFITFHFTIVLPKPLPFHVAAFKLLYKLVQSARH